MTTNHDQGAGLSIPVLVTALAALLVLFFGIQLIDGVLSHVRGADGASYVLLAKSLAMGQGFSDINLPGSPPHTQYPPLLPAVMAPVIYLAGYNFALMGAMVTLIGAGSVILAARYFSRLEGPWFGALLALCVATSHYFLFFSREVMTEVPFAFLVLLVLYFIERSDDDPRLVDGYRPYVVALPLLVTLAYMTRMIGITLYAAIVVRLALNVWESPAEDGLRRAEAKRLLTFAVAAIIPFVGWTARNTFFAGDVATYQSIFFRADYYSVDAGAMGVTDLVKRFLKNTGYYIDLIPMTVFPLAGVKSVLPGLAIKTLEAAVLLLTLLGFFHRLAQRRSVMEILLVFYLGLLTVWPTYGSGDALRYVVPMIPLIYYYFFRGVWLVSGLAKGLAGAGSVKGASVAVAVAVVLTLNLSGLKGFLWPPTAAGRVASGVEAVRGKTYHVSPGPDPRALGTDYFRDKSSACYSRYIEASTYLSSLMGPGDVAMVRKPEMAHLASGRHTVRFPYTSDKAAMDEFVKGMGVDFILLDVCYPEATKYLRPYILDRQDRFQMVLDDKQGTMVLKVLGG